MMKIGIILTYTIILFGCKKAIPELNLCRPPISVSVSVGSETTTVDWSNMAKMYWVELYKAADNSLVEGAYTNLNTYRFNNLLAGTKYLVKVSNGCVYDGETWSFSESTSKVFTTN